MARTKKNVQVAGQESLEFKVSSADIMNRLYEIMANPLTNKSDILRFLYQNIQEFQMEDTLGTITNDMISELVEIEKENNQVEYQLTADSIGTTADSSYTYEVLDIAKMTKSQKTSVLEIPTLQEARFLEDMYYQTQARRIVIENQLRALHQGADSTIENEKGSQNKSILEWFLYNLSLMEDNVKNSLVVFSDSNYLSQWAKMVTGIGPVIATCLTANLTLEEDEFGNSVMSAGNWWSFCGLNDNRRPWLGKEKSRKIFNEVLEKRNGIVDDDFVLELASRTQWSMDHYNKRAKKENGTWDKEKLISASAMIPYNKNLKIVCWKIGHSFLMCKNRPTSLYGRLLKERMELEMIRNERGDYAAQAQAIIDSKKFSKSTQAYKAYKEGMLPKAHILQRSQRYATKMFISHLYEAAYWNKYGKMAPEPYILAFSEVHHDYIGPEVPYDAVPRDCERGIHM